MTLNDLSPFSSAPSITLNVTSPDVISVMVNSAAEPPGTLSPTITLYAVPSTLTLAPRVLDDVEVGLGLAVGAVVAPGVGNGMKGSLLVNLSSIGCSLAGSAAASSAAEVSE